MNLSTDGSNKLDTALCVTSEGDRIDLQEFLDFLILAYRINDVLTSDKETQIDDTNIDWTEISRNSLFLRLSDKKHDSPDGEAEEMTRSERVERVQDVLKHKLKDIMNEGILDSVLPFIVKKTLTTTVVKPFDSMGSKINNSSNKDKICSKQKCNATDNLLRSKGAE